MTQLMAETEKTQIPDARIPDIRTLDARLPDVWPFAEERSAGPALRPRRRSPRRTVVTALLVLFAVSLGGAAIALWTTVSTPGGSGAAAATSVGQASTPTAEASGNKVIVRWTAATLGNGTPVSGYVVKRYSTTGTVQTIIDNCAGIVTNIGCIENSVPAGNWVYTVTPVFSTYWVGPESAQSATAVSTGIAPTGNVWMWVTP